MTMKSHIDFATLNEYLDQALPTARRAAVEAHLAGCADCRSQLAQLQLLFTTLDALPEVPLDHDFSGELVRTIAARPPIARAVTPPPLPWWLLALQLAGAALAARLAWPIVERLAAAPAVGASRQLLALSWQHWYLLWVDQMTAFVAASRLWWDAGRLFRPQLAVDLPSWLAIAPQHWFLLLAIVGAIWLATHTWELSSAPIQKGEPK